MAKRGRPRKEIEETWIPEPKRYKPKESYEINTFAKIKHDRVLAGYSELFTIVHGYKPTPTDMKLIHRLTKKSGF